MELGTCQWVPGVPDISKTALLEAPVHDGGSTVEGADALRPDSIIPGTRFRIVERLDEGAVGEVYLAEHLDLERPVALKILRDDPASAREVIERFRREAAMTSRIDSPYVVKVLDYGVLTDGRPFYAMEWLGASPLDGRLRSGPLPLPRALALLRMACKGLGAAHAAGLTHRDVKPENLMIVVAGRKERLVVVDFGIATPSGTAPDIHGGTPAYMSPEQVLGLPIDERSDIYSLGCVAYEMLSGRPPFSAPSIAGLLRQHADCEPPPLSRLGKQRPPEAVEAVIFRCLEKDPGDRFASMAELEAALCEAQVASSIRTELDDLPPPDVDAVRKAAIVRGLQIPGAARARRWRTGIAGAMVVMAVGAVGLMPPDRLASPSIDEPQPEPATQAPAPDPPETASSSLNESERSDLDASDADEEILLAQAPGAGARDAIPFGENDPPDAPEEREASAIRPESPAPASTTTAPERHRRRKAARLTRRGAAALSRGARDEAASLFRRALERDPDAASAMAGLSDVYFERGLYARALHYARAAVRRAPGRASYHLRLGDALYKMQRYQEARGQYERAHALGSSAAELRLRRLQKISHR